MVIRNAFTVDVEDYYHVSAFEGEIDRSEWGNYESRVSKNVDRLLELLATHRILGTFFVLGWVAEHYPQIVQRIHQAGHEIGSHSYWHRLIYQQTPDEFRADLVRSRNVLEDIIGERIVSYRAPSFSITRQSYWALNILVEEGFTIDSSIFPIRHDRYGIPDAPIEPNQLQTAAGSLWEFPVSVRKLGGLNVPVSGGGYFRLFPLAWTTNSLASINRKGRPFVFYIHPWEIDPQQPRLNMASRLGRLRHYVNLATTESKLARLLARFSFAPLREVVTTLASQSVPTPACLSH